MKSHLPSTLYFIALVLPLVFVSGCSNNGAPSNAEIKEAFNIKLKAHRDALESTGLEKLSNILIPEIDSASIAECEPLGEMEYRCKFTINFWVGDNDLQKNFTANFRRSTDGDLTYDLL